MERYENKVEEMQTIALVSALLFGFSITLWIEFDVALFNDEDYIVQTYVFSIAAICTIISSALSTVLAVAVIVSIRRLMFKFGKETGTAGLDLFKRTTHKVRAWVRYYIYISYVGLFVTLGVYSQLKWESASEVGGPILWSIIYILLVIGLCIMLYVFNKIKNAYNQALDIKTKSGD